MANKKRIATSVAAVATAAALLLGGTFAWQSISQRALNEASDVINPGGRLHNDMWYETADTTNSNIYVENFAEDDIYARVRLSEYMEIVMNKGTAAEKVETVAGSKTLKDGAAVDPDNNPTGANIYDYEYAIHYFHKDNATDTYWTWDTNGADAGDVYYMPTFNLNKDSLAPDLNGLYRDRVGGISDREMGQYVDAEGNALENYTGYADGEPMTGYEIYDGDTNGSDEIGTDPLVLADIIENGESATVSYDTTSVVLTDTHVEHYAQPIGETRGLISIDEWLEKVGYDGTNAPNYDAAEHGNYWVYDEDGWVYWSGAIAGRNEDGTTNTTGLLLDSFTLNEVMDDTWYYAIEAKGEFVTADDLGEFKDPAAAATFGLTRSGEEATGSDLPQDYYQGGTGFYENGISKDALTLLSVIGVDVFGEDEDEGGEPEPQVLTLGDSPDPSTAMYITEAKEYTFLIEAEDSKEKPANLDSLIVQAINFDTMDGPTDITNYTYNSETRILTLPIEADYGIYAVVDATGQYGKYIIILQEEVAAVDLNAGSYTIKNPQSGIYLFSGFTWNGAAVDSVELLGVIGDTSPPMAIFESFPTKDKCLMVMFDNAIGESMTVTGTATVNGQEEKVNFILHFGESTGGGSESDIPEYTLNDGITFTYFTTYGLIDDKEEDMYPLLYLAANLPEGTTYDEGSLAYGIYDKNNRAISADLGEQSVIREGFVAVLTAVPEGTKVGDAFTAVVYYKVDGVTYGKSATTEWAGEIPPNVSFRVDYLEGTALTFGERANDDAHEVDISIYGNDIVFSCDEADVASWAVVETTDTGAVSLSNTGNAITVAAGNSTPAFDLVAYDENGEEMFRIDFVIARKPAVEITIGELVAKSGYNYTLSDIGADRVSYDLSCTVGGESYNGNWTVTNATVENVVSVAGTTLTIGAGAEGVSFELVIRDQNSALVGLVYVTVTR